MTFWAAAIVAALVVPTVRAADSREKGVTLLLERVSAPKRLQHAFGVEAIMQGLARELGGDPTSWGLAGLLHDIDLAETKDDPSRHGIVGARILVERGFSPDVVHAVESHDDQAGVARTAPIDHALYSADRVYWAIDRAGLRFPWAGAGAATPASVREELERQGASDRIDAALRRECEALGLGLDEVLRLALDALAHLDEPVLEEGAPTSEG